MNRLLRVLFTLIMSLTLISASAARVINTDLLIIGGGASGTSAAIQASRMGIKTVLIEETDWLGGMLTSAGVSAIDGNHQMPSGIWGEFRQNLYDYYGGPAKVETGWVSNTLFEPKVANHILKSMANNANLTILYKTAWTNIKKVDNTWFTQIKQQDKVSMIRSKLIVDATELGDVLAYLKVPYRLGMDSRGETGEAIALPSGNNIVQDLTYVVTLKDYGKGADRTIPKPQDYNPQEFECACNIADPSETKATTQLDCAKMLTYGKLPNNKYMINWPKCGNDTYLNVVEMGADERAKALNKAKLHSLQFVYYLQTHLGFKNLGIADNEYPTKDGLPMIPYYRESRRVKGKVLFTVNDIAKPYQQIHPLYRTGIAVGDYPIDHHHGQNPLAPKLDFIQIKVPSYSIPLGALVPADTEGLIVAEKTISVTNIVEGTTRLQPVVLEIGQAAGALAAITIKSGKPLSQVNIRSVQAALLNNNAYLMPYIDVTPADKHFQIIQRIGATGLLRGVGIPYKWANQTWFYPELPINEVDLVSGFTAFYPNLSELYPSGKLCDLTFCEKLFKAVDKNVVTAAEMDGYLRQQGFNIISNTQPLSKRMLAVLIDHYLHPFDQPVDYFGNRVF